VSLILIVDDHRDTCRVLTRLVRSLGWEAEAVESGPAALKFVLGAPVRPALILLDVMMPGTDGFETLRQLRATTGDAGLPVVMMSAASDDESRDRAAQLGAVEYWVKGGFDSGRLTALLSRHAPRGAAAAAGPGAAPGVPYQLYVRVGPSWEWVCEVAAPSHGEALREAITRLRPEHHDKPIRVEQGPRDPAP
jgi:CheY-like chemotaxis protein